ncbi:hypothetical protein [Corynebacterium sphenisci]|uniref:hypothetical protein n=1 Tax=Corynebacterium sphenisci TaxID=191493 RepID=UPI0026E08E96|nr:hypothetical protein [Corynebacterium sphenisci]MDO5731549.1 hypothetical protein [Corynebacterium sphenisci]
MTEHEASETRREARRRRRAERRAAREEARGARGSRNSGIAWAAVLMSVGVAAVVSAMVVTVGAVGVAAKGPGEPRPRAVALWEQRMDATENSGGAGGQAARGRGGSREGARSASATRTRASGSTQRRSSTPRKRGGGGAPGGAPGGGAPDPEGLLPGMDALPDFETIARCIGDLGVPIAPGGGGEGGPGLPGLPAPGEGKGPGGLLPVSLVLDQDALAGAGMLQELIADLVATGGITQETIDRLHGRSLALCG